MKEKNAVQAIALPQGLQQQHIPSVTTGAK